MAGSPSAFARALVSFWMTFFAIDGTADQIHADDLAEAVLFGEVDREPGFYRLFNSVDLTGWDGQPGCWTVRNGEIWSTGEGRGRNWLIRRDLTVRDFELRLQFRFTCGNSGVQVRSKDIGDWQVRGYQVEIAEHDVMGLWHHSLMSKEDETERVRKHLAVAGQRVSIGKSGKKKVSTFAPAEPLQEFCHDDAWNDLVVVAKGPRLVQIINGQVFSDLTDHEAGFAAREGLIALQDHGEGTIAGFRNIRLRFLNQHQDNDSQAAADRPNILFVISDDQSWKHAGVYGDPVVRTPNLDRIAKEGVRFNYAFCSSPSCTPSRGTVLTGQHHWRLEEGANLHSTLPSKFACYPEMLEQVGYFVGFIGKGWGPGKNEPGGRFENPAGPEFNRVRFPRSELPADGISDKHYAANFESFLEQRGKQQPFCCWIGTHEPHRGYEYLSGLKSGFKLEDVDVPDYLPDLPNVRADILDYYREVEWFDQQLGACLQLLEERDLLNNTLVVVTSDNGMPFPRSKCSLYDSGVRLPFAVRWPKQIPGGRVIDDFIHFADIAPTFLEAAGLDVPSEMTGRSLLPLLRGNASGRVESQRDHVVFGRERHLNHANPGGVFAMRGIRTHRYLLIQNLFPELPPSGVPPHYTNVDRGPSKFAFLLEPDEPEVQRTRAYVLDKRPAIELYDCENDPDQIDNVADNPDFLEVRNRLEAQLIAERKRTGDPRALGKPVTWDTDPYYSGSGEAWVERQRDEIQQYRNLKEGDDD